MKQATPLISGGMKTLRLPTLFENLGRSIVILTAGAGSSGHTESVRERAHEEDYQAVKNTGMDPDGGPLPAHPSGRSRAEASGKTGSGKKVHHDSILGSAVKTEPCYVAFVTPGLHYCTGGFEIDCDSAAVGNEGEAIPGGSVYTRADVATHTAKSDC